MYFKPNFFFSAILNYESFFICRYFRLKKLLFTLFFYVSLITALKLLNCYDVIKSLNFHTNLPPSDFVHIRTQHYAQEICLSSLHIFKHFVTKYILLFACQSTKSIAKKSLCVWTFLSVTLCSAIAWHTEKYSSFRRIPTLE